MVFLKVLLQRGNLFVRSGAIGTRIGAIRELHKRLHGVDGSDFLSAGVAAREVDLGDGFAVFCPLHTCWV